MPVQKNFSTEVIESLDTNDIIICPQLSEVTASKLLSHIHDVCQRDILCITTEHETQALINDLPFFVKDTPILTLDAPEVLFGADKTKPSVEVMGRRLSALHNLKNAERAIVLTPLQSALQKVVQPKELDALFETWKVGTEIPFDLIAERLVELSFVRKKLVQNKGEFAVRGGIVDLFSASSLDAVRLEFFGDTIEQIRTFDPASQRSIEKIDEVILSPCDEWHLLKQADTLVPVTEYLNKPLIFLEDITALEDKYAFLKGSLTPTYLDIHELLKTVTAQIWSSPVPIQELGTIKPKANGRISFSMFSMDVEAKCITNQYATIGDFFHTETKEDLLRALSETELEVVFIAQEEKTLQVLQDAVQPLPKKYRSETGYLSSGYVDIGEKEVYFPYAEYTQRRKLARTKYRNTYHTPASDFHQLEEKDLVVHYHNGIGKYLGIESRENHEGELIEFMVIEYAEQSKLYVPVSQSYLISRYIGATEESPSLHKLGTTRWQQMRTKAQQSVMGYAKELLQHQAEREHKGGWAYPEDSIEIKEFADSFPYTETEDQLRAIRDISRDMQSDKSMDRLICGDVGYGKTEVAMRAAFKAVMDGNKQVALLVPTTVLAMQHTDTFKERTEPFGVRIACVSRFQTTKENKETLKNVAEGKVDILIGTHRLVSKDIQFKDLGLIIIDEEQRFGVRVKEKLKAFKTGVDTLTLTATPIPRTLYLSLIQLRSMSVINSPPQDRLPIQSFLVERDNNVIKQALLRELAREGQIYFIHNRVESIYRVAKELQQLVPHMRVKVAHGQMDGDALDEVFCEFVQGDVDLLVATTLVENGIDVPLANTIFIDRADTFGVSDLYQLRGRVGRWNRLAYAYFLVPPGRQLTQVSHKRLNSLIETSGLGGGMKLAMLDLEIRGAGDIIGVQQSGHVSSIGFHLYCKMLKRAITALKDKKNIDFIETKLDLPFDAKFPEYYIDDVSLRLELYNRLGEVTSTDEAEEIRKELLDRFGPLPEPAEWLLSITRLRIFLQQHQFTLLKLKGNTLYSERHLRTKTQKKTCLIPFPHSGEELEQIVIKRITEEFYL